MLRWGSANLESDKAVQYLRTKVMEPLESQILSVLKNDLHADADGDGCATMIAVDALAAVCAHFGETTRMKKRKLKQIQKKYLEVWSRTIDELDPVEGHKTARQAHIQASFARLIGHAK